MKKSEKILQYMRLAYAGGMYSSGIVARERLYLYRLTSTGSIDRCNVRLYDHGCPVWEAWASTTMVISALSGGYASRKCLDASLQSLFAAGGTASVWDAYRALYNAPAIV